MYVIQPLAVQVYPEAQPSMLTPPYGLSLVHNGNLNQLNRIKR